MLKSEKVYISISHKNIDYWTEKLHKTLKNTQKVEVNVSDLPTGSHVSVEVICDNCGEIIKVSYRNYIKCMNRYNNYYCRKCGPIHYQQSMQEKYGVDNSFQLPNIKEKSKKTMIEKYGVEYNAQRPDIKEKYLIGSANVSYIDGRSKNYPDRLQDKQNVTWKTNQFKKFHYHCVICNSQSHLHAHHLFNYIDNIELRHDMNNGVVLCADCHRNFHHIYGNKDNNVDQFISFLESQTTSPDECKGVREELINHLSQVRRSLYEKSKYKDDFK